MIEVWLVGTHVLQSLLPLQGGCGGVEDVLTSVEDSTLGDFHQQIDAC